MAFKHVPPFSFLAAELEMASVLGGEYLPSYSIRSCSWLGVSLQISVCVKSQFLAIDT